MGYKVQRKVYKLRFPDRDGLVVRARSLPLGQFLEISELADRDGQTTEDTRRLLRKFADALIEWNLEDDETGVPLPATYDSLCGLDAEFVLELVDAWTDAVAGVSAPLERPSTSGASLADLPVTVLPAAAEGTHLAS